MTDQHPDQQSGAEQAPSGGGLWMMPALSDETLAAVLSAVAVYGSDRPVWWRRGAPLDPAAAPDDPHAERDLRLLVDCSDVFAWGCADAMEVTEVNAPLLLATVGDVARAVSDYDTERGHEVPRFDIHDAVVVFCAREAQMRPQGAMYPHLHPATWPLLDVCGAERATGFGNPKPQPVTDPDVRVRRPWWGERKPGQPGSGLLGEGLAPEALCAADVRRVLKATEFDSTDMVCVWNEPGEPVRLFLIDCSYRGTDADPTYVEVHPGNLATFLATDAEVRAVSRRPENMAHGSMEHHWADDVVMLRFVARTVGLPVPEAARQMVTSEYFMDGSFLLPVLDLPLEAGSRASA